MTSLYGSRVPFHFTSFMFNDLQPSVICSRTNHIVRMFKDVKLLKNIYMYAGNINKMYALIRTSMSIPSYQLIRYIVSEHFFLYTNSERYHILMGLSTTFNII